MLDSKSNILWVKAGDKSMLFYQNSECVAQDKKGVDGKQ